MGTKRNWDFYPNTELDIDLKLITRKPGRMSVGDSINCMLTRNGDYHYTAVENAIKKKVTEKRSESQISISQLFHAITTNHETPSYSTYNLLIIKYIVYEEGDCDDENK